MTNEFHPGQVVRTIEGQTRTILLQDGCSVVVYRPVGEDGVTDVARFHSTKLFVR